jgi:regulator of replication initiation timing
MIENKTEKSEQPNRNNKLFYVLFILLLLGFNVFMYLNNRQVNTEKNEIVDQKAKLDSTYNLLKRDFEKVTAKNLELEGIDESKDSLIAILRNALDNKRRELETKYLNKETLTEAELKDAKRLIAELQTEKKEFMNLIERLRKDNEYLARSIDTVKGNLRERETENNSLKTENNSLRESGSILSLSNIIVTGFNSKGKTKEVATSNVKRIDFLKICFDINKNAITPVGQNLIAYRILSPNNTILLDLTKGNGLLRNQETGIDIKYTNKVEFNFNGDRQATCDKYYPVLSLEKGVYTIEFYNKGYLIGGHKFTLTSSLL